MNESVGLRWTGHPVIDMGVGAVVVAIAAVHDEVNSPEGVTERQWNDLIDTLEQDYLAGLYRKPSMILLTNNSLENPSATPTTRAIRIRDVFGMCRTNSRTVAENCTYFPERTAATRAARDLIPLVHGRGNINFYPLGGAGLPLSNLALGCVLALPLASPIVSGRLMIVAMDQPDFLLELCDSWRRELDAEFAKLRLAGGDLPERKKARTRLFDKLKELFTEQGDRRPSTSVNSGVTLYHLTNSGNGPTVDIHTVPPHVTTFLQRAGSAVFKPIWDAVTRAFWRDAKGRLQGTEPDPDSRKVCANDLFESLARMPDEAPTFVRRFFLGFVRNRVGESDAVRAVDVDVWPLVELFLQEVMHMDKERVEKIRMVADELAREIEGNNDKRLYRQLMGVEGGKDQYAALRQLLIRATRERLRRGGDLLVSMDDFLRIFEEAEEYPRADWRLARDLLRLRCLEELHRKGYFIDAPELLVEESEAEQDMEAAPL
jgi:CRISPR-associated protein Cst1